MRIFYSSSGGDPMLLDREEALHSLATELGEFAAGRRVSGVFTAEMNGSPEPYTAFLCGIRVQKTAGGSPELYLANDQWLELRASVPDLEKLCHNVALLKNGDHTHLYAGPISLIVEADDSWPGFNGG
jgi:hypothetical protein